LHPPKLPPSSRFHRPVSGAATIAEAEPIKNEISKRIKEISAQMESDQPEDRAALKSFFGK
jgi:hypothetical protein